MVSASQLEALHASVTQIFHLHRQSGGEFEVTGRSVFLVLTHLLLDLKCLKCVDKCADIHSLTL